jgi:tRNA (guanosine-2'-O-)-methyltransferase
VPFDAELIKRYGASEVIRVLTPLVLEPRRDLLRQVIDRRRSDLTVLADHFYDPHNNAAVLRSAEAFGLRAVHAVAGDQGAKLAPAVTQGVEKWIDFIVHASTDAAAHAIEAQGYMLVGADMHGEPPEAMPKDTKLCIVMGAEKWGLSDAVRARCKRLVCVPMAGMVESFNVSVAAALLMYGLSTQRPPTRLTDPEKTDLLARYLIQTVQRPTTLLSELLDPS